MTQEQFNTQLKDPSQDGCCEQPGATLLKGSLFGLVDMNGGWIKLHRSIADHWIYEDARKFKWWVDLLLMVNHEPKKVLIKGELIECQRGQTVKSLDTLAVKWLVTKKTVKSFLELLQRDGMIYTENVKISTRITICNYDNYQESVNGEGNKSKRKLPPNKKVITINSNNTWRTDFDIYKKECANAFSKLSQDYAFLQRLRFYYPKINSEKSLSKSYEVFWGTESGWENKKKSKSTKIDWAATIMNTIKHNLIEE